ncbi:26S proteasome non-ATPase regulatory subunit 4 [Lamellibrachia satsuma]|nr:26S proteasome non-ATPase regulatory subunit 4 [Lamellibrachia satsuma]
MVLESTMVCVDNSDYMRNGDYLPTRLQAQQDAVNLICHSKTRANPENNLGLMTLANTEVLVTLTGDTGRILARLHQVHPRGLISFISGVRIAHLALKHRQGKNHKTRIIVFIGSPVDEEEKELIKLAKRLKKEKVNVDIVNFGEEAVNTDKLTTFVNTINGKEGSSSHLVTVSSGPMLSDALISSPIVMGEDGTGAVPGGMAGYEFGIDPNEDPELALALRVSMEEQRARQEEEATKPTGDAVSAPAAAPHVEETDEEALLKQALDMSMDQDAPDDSPGDVPNVSSMTEEEQIAYAMQMSLGPSAADSPVAGETPMETDAEEKTGQKKEDDEDYSEVINDPAFLQSVLEGLPGVDPQSDAIRQAMGQLTQKDGAEKGKKDDKKEGKK